LKNKNKKQKKKKKKKKNEPAVPSGQWPGGQPPSHQSLTSKGRAGSRTSQPVVSGQRPVTSAEWPDAQWPVESEKNGGEKKNKTCHQVPGQPSPVASGQVASHRATNR